MNFHITPALGLRSVGHSMKHPRSLTLSSLILSSDYLDVGRVIPLVRFYLSRASNHIVAIPIP